MIRKLENIQMPTKAKMDMLKMIKDIMSSDLAIDIFINLDCDIKRKNSIQQMLEALVHIYLGIKVPEVTF
jgi:hypothetical protein